MSTATDLAPITIEPTAAAKVAEFIATCGEESAHLRLGVRGGGCSGFQYSLGLDHINEEDHVFESEGQEIIVDPESYPYLAGARIIYRESLMSQGFDVENPNAVAACGCGSSFRVADEAPSCGASLPGEDEIYS